MFSPLLMNEPLFKTKTLNLYGLFFLQTMTTIRICHFNRKDYFHPKLLLDVIINRYSITWILILFPLNNQIITRKCYSWQSFHFVSTYSVRNYWSRTYTHSIFYSVSIGWNWSTWTYQHICLSRALWKITMTPPYEWPKIRIYHSYC